MYILNGFVTVNVLISLSLTASQLQIESTLAKRTWSTERWPLAGLGRLSSRIIGIFFTPTAERTFSQSFDIVESSQGYIPETLLYVNTRQVLCVLALFGASLVILASVLLVAWIHFYKYREKLDIYDSKALSTVNIRTQGLFLFLCLVLATVMALFGGVVFCVSSARFTEVFPDIFKFASYALSTSEPLKEHLLESLVTTHPAEDALRKANVKTFSELNRLAMTYFTANSRGVIYPVLVTSRSLTTKIGKAEIQVEIQKNSIKWIAGGGRISPRVIDFRTSVSAILNYNGSFHNDSRLIRMANLESYPIVKHASFQTALESLKKLKGNAQSVSDSISSLLTDLSKAASMDNVNGCGIVNELDRLINQTALRIQRNAKNFISFANSSAHHGRREINDEMLREYREQSLKKWNLVVPIFVVTGSVFTILVALVLATASVGIISTDELSIKRLMQESKTHCFMFLGRFLFWSSYVSLCLVWSLWCMSVVLFLWSGVAVQVCVAKGDSRLFALTVGNPNSSFYDPWYTLFSSVQFNTTLENSIDNCRKDPSYFPLLPDPMIIPSKDLWTVSNETVENSTFPQNWKNVHFPDMTSTIAPLLNLSTILNGLTQEPIFDNIKSYYRKVLNLSALQVLQEIENEWINHGIRAPSLFQNAVQSYNDLTNALSFAMKLDSIYYNSIQIINSSLASISEQALDLQDGVDRLSSFVAQGDSRYQNLVEKIITLTLKLDLHQLETHAKEFRKSLHFCVTLLTLNDNWKFLVCEQLLYPVANAWFGIVFLAVFLVVSCVLALKFVSLLAHPPTPFDFWRERRLAYQKEHAPRYQLTD